MSRGINALFPMILDNINDGVITVDKHFRITSFNAAAERMTGIDRGQAVGKKLESVFQAQLCPHGSVLRDTLESGKPKRNIRIELPSMTDSSVMSVSTTLLRDHHHRVIGGMQVLSNLNDAEELPFPLKKCRNLQDIIGQSPAIQELYALLPKFAKSDGPILITGAEGTGKEFIARAIHNLSHRKNRAFILVDCSSVPASRIDSELFGGEYALFAAIEDSRPGSVQQAHRGTLFLRNVDSLPLSAQARLLRIIEEKRIDSLSIGTTAKIDIRVISTSRAGLEGAVQKRRFRDDLYYRIGVLPIELPLLTERREDIPLLASHFVKLAAARKGLPPRRIDPLAMRALLDYDYPTNIKELKQIIERASALCDGTDQPIHLGHLPDEVLRRSPLPLPTVKVQSGVPTAGIRLDEENAELRQLITALEKCNWNRSQVALALQISRTTLWRRMKGYGLIDSLPRKSTLSKA